MYYRNTSVKNMAFGRENQTTPWQGVHFFTNTVSKGVFMQDMVKSRCKFVTLLGKYAQPKQVGWGVIFSELGFAGSRARKPRRELEGPSTFFAACSVA